MRLKINCIVFFLLVSPSILWSQDTVFMARHILKGTVHNVVEAGGEIYAKAGQILYRKSGDTWIIEKKNLNKPFVFYNEGFFESDYIPKMLVVDPGPFRQLIPQASLANCTKATQGDRLFLAVGGALYEFAINNNYAHTYVDKSVRDIYLDDGLELVSTYGGIYIKDSSGSRKAKGVDYSNGDYWHTEQGDFLLNDWVYERVTPDSFARLPLAHFPELLGRTRKGVRFRDSLVVQLTNSICYFNRQYGFTAIYEGEEYTDLEVLGDSLIFSTSSGQVYSGNGRSKRLLADLNFRIIDIYLGSAGIFLSGDQGVYRVSHGNWNDVEQVCDKPLAVGVLEDYSKNLWVATYSGMFVIPNGRKEVLSFLENIEFNRGALLYYDDGIYAGSVQGLYAIGFYSVSKDFLPKALNRISAERRKTFLILLLALVASGIAVYFTLRLFKRQKISAVSLSEPHKSDQVLSAEAIIADIKAHHIQTVEALAEFYKTNPVQLNRIFKAFDTTPGKLLKKAKLEFASECLQQGIAIEEISAKTGYSAAFIKSELRQKKV